MFILKIMYKSDVTVDQSVLKGILKWMGLKWYEPLYMYMVIQENVKRWVMRWLLRLVHDGIQIYMYMYVVSWNTASCPCLLYVCQGGLWCFGGTGLAFAHSLSSVPDNVVTLFCLYALVKHSRVRIEWKSLPKVCWYTNVSLWHMFICWCSTYIW